MMDQKQFLSAFTSYRLQLPGCPELSYRVYHPADDSENLTPVICLHSLTTNSRSYEALAAWLAHDRLVICPDFRGRGKSGKARDPKSYSLKNYVSDTLAILEDQKIDKFIAIGTGIGGHTAIALAAEHPHRVASLILNDTGPMLSPLGVERKLKDLRLPDFHPGWEEAAAFFKEIHSDCYPRLSDEGWLQLAKQRYEWRKDLSGIRPSYDPAVAHSFSAANRDRASDLWAMFAKLTHIPALCLHGALSDMLSTDTLRRMRSEHPNLLTVTIPNTGHAPLLSEPESLDALEAFLATVR